MLTYSQHDARLTFLLLAASAERNYQRMTISVLSGYAQEFYEEAVRFYGMAAKLVA